MILSSTGACTPSFSIPKLFYACTNQFLDIAHHCRTTLFTTTEQTPKLPEEEEEKKTSIENGKECCDDNCECDHDCGAECDDCCAVEGEEECGCGHDHDHAHAHDFHMHKSDPNDPVTAICEKINEDLEAWETKGELTEDKLQDALKRFEEALKMTSNHMDALLGKAYVQGELGNAEEAAKTLMLAGEVDPRDVRVMTMLQEMGDFGDDDRDMELISRFIAVEKEGLPSPLFKKVLTAVFDRFATAPYAPPAEPRVSVLDAHSANSLSKEDMNRFFIHTNGTPITTDAIDYLFSGEWVLDAKGNLSLEGFIEFYINQTFADPHETIKDLQKLGYNEHMQPI